MASVDTAELVRALGAAARLAGSYAPHSTRGSVRVGIEDASLSLTVSGDVPACLTLPATQPGTLFQGPAAAVVPAALLGQLASHAGTDEVQLSINHATEVSLVAGGFDVNAAHPAADAQLLEQFTLPAVPDDGLTVDLDAAELVRGLSATLYATSKEAFQAIFRGLHLTFDMDGLQLVATDGYRVAVARLAASVTAAGAAVIHRTHADELLRLLTRVSGPVALRLTPSHLIVRAPGLLLHLPLMDGEFPDWRRTMPNGTTRLVLDTEAFKAALARCAVMTDNTCNHRVELRMFPGESRLELSAENDYGRMHEEVSAQWEGVEPRTVGVNVSFLREALACMHGRLTLGFANLGGPFLIESDAPGLRAILVTLRA